MPAPFDALGTLARLEDGALSRQVDLGPDGGSSLHFALYDLLRREQVLAAGAAPPSPEAMAAHQKFNEELVKAGVVVGAGRLAPSAQGKRVRFDGKKRTLIDGPFAETKELVAGYWLWQVRSMDEALEWLKRAPYDGGIFEIREISMSEGV